MFFKEKMLFFSLILGKLQRFGNGMQSSFFFFFASHPPLKLEALIWQFIGSIAGMQCIGKWEEKKEQSTWC